MKTLLSLAIGLGYGITIAIVAIELAAIIVPL